MQSNAYPFPEERRLATVLFADVQGFTALSEKHDFETTSDLIKELWLRLDTIIDNYQGYIDKHIGDAVMAVWGAPYASENDAEQAVMAALALQESFREYQENTDRLGVGELKLRIGINSGPVLSGYVGIRSEYTVMGDTVNVANRLEHAAEPGTILISENTFRLVRGIFQVRRFANPLHLRGRTEPVQAFIVDGLMPQPSRMRYRSVDSLETLMVGREAELERMNEIYKEAIQADQPTLILVTGEAGLGKSRLLMEFTNFLELNQSDLTIMSARALAQTAQIPFYFWKALWYLRFGLSETDPEEVTRERFLREIQRIWGFQLGPASSVEVAHLIGSLIGIIYPDSPYLAAFENDAEGRVNRAFELTKELLRRVSALRPTVLVIDDLQWADSGSLALMSYLFEPGELPMQLLVLGGARPEFIRQHLRWVNIAYVIELEPLPVEAGIVAEAYPDLRALPEEVLAELALRADGNPYFMEELAKSLVKSGMHQAGLSSGEILEHLRTHMPESLRVMLQARLDSLPREARAVALLASVVGRVFWVGAVIAAARVAEGMGTGPLVSMPEPVIDRIIQDALRQLVRAELAFPRANSPYSQEQEYIFKHSLLREVAYSMIPHKNRSRYHLAVGLWLAEHDNPEFKIMSAEHLEWGGAYLDAARSYEAAAEISQMRGAAQEAEALVQRARLLRAKVAEGKTAG